MKKMELLVYIGTYTEKIRFGTGQIFKGKGEGIHICKMDPASGSWQPYAVTRGVKSPSYLAFHPGRRFLYAVNELKEHEGRATGTLSAFTVDAASGELRFINKAATHGTDPCHLSVDRTGRYVLVSNFASGSVAVLPIRADGGLEEASDVVQHTGSSSDPVRQSGPHAHSVTLDATNRFVYVPDLGLDRLMIYRFDAKRGKLKAHDQPWLETKPGAGPRHFVFHPGNSFAYLINELDSTILSLRYHGERGILEEIQTVPTLPDSFRGHSSCADIHVHPSGRYLFGSNRGHDSIVIYEIDENRGTLNYVAHEPTGGKTPRNFVIDPKGTFLFAANQDSDNVVHFRIDQQTGRISPSGEVTNVPTPVCLKILQL
ncbi:MAG: lactonase family protein [Spirochaetaceae bacterium]|nr:MAG: lactonase family protein [Spirochaetaceae bacterium]